MCEKFLRYFLISLEVILKKRCRLVSKNKFDEFAWLCDRVRLIMILEGYMKTSMRFLLVLGAYALLPRVGYAEDFKIYEISNKAGTCKVTIATLNEPDDNFKWSSEKCINGKAAGKGWVAWSDERKWQGDFEDGFRKYGRFVYPGGWCEGKYKEALEGQAKCFDSNYGLTFEGNYHMGVRSGIVTEKGNGTYFKGLWAHDQKNGYGEMQWANGDRYKGNYKDGLYDGKGKYIYASGQIYEGDYKEDDRDGKGRMTYPNGDWYEGEFKRDSKNGQGIYYWAEHNERFVGLFRDGDPVSKKGKYLKGEGK
ncbi:hypothetical protein M6G53_20555 [Serratia nevei]|uniref:MORN repeat-containing protein n=1 Tax=Serratia nevei TaxID=2703794 RepID=UPI00209F9386|nr:hypothetical protein [Serratia nevei]MCP1107765.1 hypothetical protein [Serratia nevei]